MIAKHSRSYKRKKFRHSTMKLSGIPILLLHILLTIGLTKAFILREIVRLRQTNQNWNQMKREYWRFVAHDDIVVIMWSVGQSGPRGTFCGLAGAWPTLDSAAVGMWLWQVASGYFHGPIYPWYFCPEVGFQARSKDQEILEEGGGAGPSLLPRRDHE